MSIRLRFTLSSMIVALLAAGGPGLAAQTTLDRSPNLTGAWSGEPGTVYFHFLHRFNHSGAPARKVTNSPTFLLAGALPYRVLAGLNYATNSTVAASYPNEWELFGRWLPLDAGAGGPVDAAVQAGYNVAASSVDGELTLGRRFGSVRLLAAGRVLGDAFGGGSTRFAAGGGASVRLSRSVAVAGDVVTLLDRGADEELAWSAGLQLAIPYTPHSLSLHAANTGTGTLQGSARGGSRVTYGFEFTVPVTLARYFGRRPAPVAEAEPVPFASDAGLITATMRQLAYTPASLEVAVGTTIEWRNDDAVPHTVTATDGSWDSGDIAPGETWRRQFDRPGTYPFHCTPHPFMRGVVVVR